MYILLTRLCKFPGKPHRKDKRLRDLFYTLYGPKNDLPFLCFWFSVTVGTI